MEFFIYLQSFHKIPSILSVVFVDKYKKFKPFLPSGSLICALSQPSEVAEAILTSMKPKQSSSSPMDLCLSWNTLVMVKGILFTCMC